MGNLKIGLFMAIFIAFTSLLIGCNSTPSAGTPTFVADVEKFNAGVQSDIQKLQPVLVALTPAAESAVNIGLSLSGNGALVPANEAGVAAITALQQAIVTNSGIDSATASTITNAAALGLKASGNSKLVPYTPAASAVIANLVNSANTLPASIPINLVGTLPPANTNGIVPAPPGVPYVNGAPATTPSSQPTQ